MSGASLFDNLAPWPKADFSEFGEVEVRPLSRIQTLTGAVLGRNWVSIPHVTHHDEADITDMEARRKAWNAAHREANVTPVVVVVRALAQGLVAFAQFNTSLDDGGKNLVFKKYVHVGVAVDTPRGLLVAVLRDADRKSLTDLAAELAALSAKARDKGLSMAEMSGGCITVSSLGHIGGTAFTPIVNAPEVAILGVARAAPRPRPSADGGVDWRQMLPLSLSYDHRVINGADAARFTRFIADRLDAEDMFQKAS